MEIPIYNNRSIIDNFGQYSMPKIKKKTIVSRRRYVYPYVHGGITIPQYENTINL
jgi:hypothetical protein